MDGIKIYHKTNVSLNGLTYGSVLLHVFIRRLCVCVCLFVGVCYSI